ncbi:hypothetical protein GOBAR_DD28462 [Gossypium barbadense]|nr:hypothetical protein GOBAR_DD28462 [Gossypium barbadense]
MQQCKTKTTLENPNSKLLLMSSPPKNIDLISCGSMIHVSDIKLIRTDTTLDLSQKAEKGRFVAALMDMIGEIMEDSVLPDMGLREHRSMLVPTDPFLLVSTSMEWSQLTRLSLSYTFFTPPSFSSYLSLEFGRGCAHASPTATNYDIGSPSWGGLKAAPLPSAMVVTTPGHESS